MPARPVNSKNHRLRVFCARTVKIFLSSLKKDWRYNITHSAQWASVIHSEGKLAWFVGLPILSTKSVDNLVGRTVRSLKLCELQINLAVG